MKYDNIINELSVEKITDLFISNKLKWKDIDLINHQHKIEQLSLEQLQSAHFENNLSDPMFLEKILKFSKDSSAYKLALHYFNNDPVKVIKTFYDQSFGKKDNSLLNKFIKEHPEKISILKDSIQYFNDNTITLLYNEDMKKVAQLINEEKIHMFTFSEHADKFSIAPLNTLIDDKMYNHPSVIESLFKVFPRDIPFSQKAAEKIVDVRRKFFLDLPIENQAEPKLFKFATSNVIWGDGGWGSYDEVDSKNIPMKEVDARILDYIKEDYNAVEIALKFVEHKNNHIYHKNVQRLIDNDKFSTRFSQYSKYLIDSQKTLAGIYNVENVPNVLDHDISIQTNEVLAAFIIKAKEKSEMKYAFHVLLHRKVEFKTLFDQPTQEYVIHNLDYLLKDISVDHIKNEQIAQLTNFVIDHDIKDFASLKIIEKFCKNNKTFENIIMNRLSTEDKLAYIEYIPRKSTSKKNKIK